MSKHRRKIGLCPNCHEILAPEDNFCKNCGQENHDLNVPIHHLVGEFLESIFHIDTKFWHTIKAIFTKPGKITSDFVAGKRASYMPPARLYIFTSFVFFLLVTVVADKFIEKNNSKGKFKSFLKTTATSDFYIDGKKIRLKIDEAERVGKFSNAQLDSILTATKIANTPKNREALKVIAINSQAILNALFSDGKTTFVKDSITEKMIVLDSAALRLLKNFSDNQLHDYLASKNTKPTAKDFQNFKIDIQEFNGIFKENKSKKEQFTRNFINNIPKGVLDKAPKRPTSAQIDSVLKVNNIENTFHKRLTVKLYHHYKEFSFEKDSRELTHKFFKNMSWVMFILMPFVAIILLTIYYRSRRNYYEYFIFSIHIHSILFLFASLELIIRMLLKSSVQIPVFTFLIMYIYFFFAIKNVYKQSWRKTIMKFVLLNISYGIIFITFLFGAVIWSLATLK